MGHISNSVLLGEIDHMTAVTKAQSTSYTSTVDCFDVMVKEQNPDDLISGVTAAETTDDKLDAGTSAYAQWNLMLSWLNTRSTAAGSTDTLGLLADRHLRVPSDFDSYIWYPSRNSHVPAARLFTSTAQTLGTMVHGATYATGSILPSTISYNEVAASVATGTIGSGGWNLTVGVTYSDSTASTEAVAIAAYATGGSPAVTIGRQVINGAGAVKVSAAGQKNIYVSSTTNITAGQTIILKDYTVPSLLATNTIASDVVFVDPAQCGHLSPGDAIYLTDNNTANESAAIKKINYEFGQITLDSACAGTFTTAQNAFISLQTTGLKAWSEVHAVASVTLNTAVTIADNLQHSYYNCGYIVRPVKDVRTVVTASAGTAGDSVYIKAIPERTVVQE